MAAVLDSKEQTHHVSVELLCVLAVINLTISPSKSVKAVAYHVLSRFSLFVLDLPASHSSEEQDISTSYHISKPALLLPKLLHHLWSKPSSSCFSFMKYIATKASPDSGQSDLEANYWTHQINAYLTALHREKHTLDVRSSKTTSVAISSLISSVASVLVMHPKLGTSAAESLAMLGTSDPRLGMPLFVVILFYSKILCSSGKFSAEISASLLSCYWVEALNTATYEAYDRCKQVLLCLMMKCRPLKVLLLSRPSPLVLVIAMVLLEMVEHEHGILQVPEMLLTSHYPPLRPALVIEGGVTHFCTTGPGVDNRWS